ncbi:bifunctional oligoribonuclease/PAP phosphatase NrnA [Paludibacteraceae bacterium OttesenSCG-928-F17]|nr:bifunctional oligoribonuclease/PAP phosphatase NrnA [Paludibacteraceae bacterium OttesenSCG-928-F17]
MLSKIIAADLISRVREAIDIKEKVVIVSHVGPDGDAVGSSLALWHYLRVLGKEAHVILPDKFPSFLDWMPGTDEIIIYAKDKSKAEKLLNETDLIFALDFNAPKRLEKMAAAFVKASAPKILIDHHLYPDDFPQVCISYPEISSTSELVFRVICRMGHFDKINLECAECVLTGIMTDTGGFSYNSNSPELYAIVSELIKIGVDKDDIYRKVFNTFSVDRLKLNAFSIYKKMKLYPQYKAAIIPLSLVELEQFNYKSGDTEGLVNTPLQIDGIIFSVLLREDSDKIKISFRSQGSFPANKVAADLFGGGGHLNAAGAESYTSLQVAVNLLKKSLPKYVSYLESEEIEEEKG